MTEARSEAATMTDTSVVVGSRSDAADALYAELGASSAVANPLALNYLGSGEDRSCWMIRDVVYKIARRRTANPHEHEVLSAWRAAGAAWAPPTTVWMIPDPVMPEHEWPVLAMPYLPNDGALDEATLVEIRVAAPDVWADGNCVHHQGQTYLIDGGDVERLPH
jgi:hypothetical protein